MNKETILEKVDNMAIGNKSSIAAKQVQVYRNIASTLKKLKQKHFVIRRIGEEYIIFRLM